MTTQVVQPQIISTDQKKRSYIRNMVLAFVIPFAFIVVGIVLTTFSSRAVYTDPNSYLASLENISFGILLLGIFGMVIVFPILAIYLVFKLIKLHKSAENSAPSVIADANNQPKGPA